MAMHHHKQQRRGRKKNLIMSLLLPALDDSRGSNWCGVVVPYKMSNGSTSISGAASAFCGLRHARAHRNTYVKFCRLGHYINPARKWTRRRRKKTFRQVIRRIQVGIFLQLGRTVSTCSSTDSGYMLFLRHSSNSKALYEYVVHLEWRSADTARGWVGGRCIL